MNLIDAPRSELTDFIDALRLAQKQPPITLMEAFFGTRRPPSDFPRYLVPAWAITALSAIYERLFPWDRTAALGHIADWLPLAVLSGLSDWRQRRAAMIALICSNIEAVTQGEVRELARGIADSASDFVLQSDSTAYAMSVEATRLALQAPGAAAVYYAAICCARADAAAEMIRQALVAVAEYQAVTVPEAALKLFYSTMSELRFEKQRI